MTAVLETPKKAPSRPGRKPITDPLHLAPSERTVLVFIDERGSERDGVALTKRALAESTGRNIKTVDRAVSSLRRRGMVEAVPQYDEAGGQLSNAYRVTLLARRTYPELLQK